MQVTRGTSVALLKKRYRNLSLELHPDKNKAPEAKDEFLRVKHAFDVLVDGEMRKVYDRLGDAGVKVSANAVIDHKYIIIQMLVYYCSSLIFAFFMTFSEPSGDALSMSIFGLVLMLLVEALLVLEEKQIPVWLLPYHTSHDVVSLTHRLFPAYMNGCRCIVGAFYVDSKAMRVEKLGEICDKLKTVSVNAVTIMNEILNKFHSNSSSSSSTSKGGRNMLDGIVSKSDLAARGFFSCANQHIQEKIAANNDLADKAPTECVLQKTSIVQDKNRLRAQYLAADGSFEGFALLRNLGIFIISRYVFRNSFPSSSNY